MVAPFLPDPEKVAAVRDALPATGAGIYLNTGSAGPLAAEAIRAMREVEDWEIRVGRASWEDWEAFLDRMEEARAVVAAVLAADPPSVALTHSTTDGMNVASHAPEWRRGDRAVTTNLEHPGGLGPLVALRDSLGVDLAVAGIADGGDDERTLDALERAITPRTRLVSVSHVTWATGAVLPVAQIAELARRRDAWFVVDGAQSAGAIPTDVGSLGADFFALSGQKWLLGPEGTGALWASERAQAHANQGAAGYLSFESIGLDGTATPWADARRFEATTFHRPSIVGLARSVGWLEMYVGLEWAYERAAGLARQAADSLAEVPGVTLLTPRERMATLVTFRVAGWPSEALRTELSRRVFAITRTLPALDALRISVGFFNTDEELGRFVEAVAELARYTPETLPRRPSLVVVQSGPLREEG